MKLNKFGITLESFESLTENNVNQLVGGFSKSFSTVDISYNELLGNNCHGMNCFAGCGSGGGQNQVCNTALGCGGLL